MRDLSAPLRIAKQLFLISLASALMAFNINTFVKAGGLIPGGFTGLTLLTQEICQRYGAFRAPFSLIYYALNAVPAIICFKFIGKRFTLLSILMVFLSGLLTDFMPAMFINFLQLQDTLLSAVFGGLLNGICIALCLYADATSGGTDFIAIFISEKYHRDAWNYIFAGNCVILVLAACLFSLDKALYSIIFQFVTTKALGVLYRGYQQMTLLIITAKCDEVYFLIRSLTNHSVTSVKAIGNYEKKEREILYSVVYSNEVAPVIRAIKKTDPDAFVNVIKTEQINGRFYRQPKE
ncbi:MAG: YitT family protein [Treponema sp.]|jgi:uncharacterized membrane-anchored protein YitT (DUF2179 family)|nr:YitT family protein [Treponema sp.]